MGEFDELARELRDRVGPDIRQEAAEDETLTELQRLRSRDLAEAAREAMHRGDLITIQTAGITLSDPVEYVGGDYLTMEAAESVVDVLLARATLFIEPRQRGGRSGKPAAWTFRARLAQHEQSGNPIELILDTGDRIRGVLDVVAADHLVVTDGESGSRLVPTPLVVAVLSRPRPGPY